MQYRIRPMPKDGSITDGVKRLHRCYRSSASTSSRAVLQGMMCSDGKQCPSRALCLQRRISTAVMPAIFARRAYCRDLGNAPHLPLSLRSSSLISSMSGVMSKSRPPAEILCLPSLVKLHGTRYASVSRFGKF